MLRTELRLRLAGVLVAAGVLLIAGASAAAAPPTLPPATYQTVSQEVLIPMDDGVKLAATVVLPSLDGKTPAPGRFPVVLQMTPYGRDGVCGCTPGADFASRGIVGAQVDVRGTGGSGGSLKDNYFSPREARDGYELVEYFGTRPYSSGRVGMTGGSYLGITQYLAAELQPPHLSVITPIEALSDLYREGYTHEGIPNFFFDEQYLAVQQPASLTGVNASSDYFQETLDAKIQQSGGTANVPFDYLSRPNDGSFYRDRSPLYNAGKIEVPALIYDGWHDGFIFGADQMYRQLSKRRGVETRLYVDPCTHKGCGPPFDTETNPSNIENSEAVVFEFLRKYLVPGASEPARPPVRVYVQGQGQWLDTTSWPPPNSQQRTLYLEPSGLNSGRAGASGTQSYFTDPAAGLSMSFDQYGTVAASPYIPLDQRAEEEQGVTWRTPALGSPLTLAGDSVLHLVAASTASDTDWFAKLADVAPDGSESIITEGFLRASHRALDPARSTPDSPWHTNTDPAPIDPGRNYDYDLAVWPTTYQLGAGHRLQLRLTSYDFPTHLPGTLVASTSDPSATSFVPLSPATNTVSEGGPDPSYLRVTALGPPAAAPARPVCAARRRVAVRLPRLRRQRIVHAAAFAGHRRVGARSGHNLRRLVVHGVPRRGVRLRLVLRTSRHRRVVRRRTVRGC